MGHKAIVIFDLDHLDQIDRDPLQFCRRLQDAILSHKRTGGSVHVNGATVADAVWSGHTSQTPVLKFQDFSAVEVTEK